MNKNERKADCKIIKNSPQNRKWTFQSFLAARAVKTDFQTLGSETIFDNWKPFKNDEKCFLFHLKSSFRSQNI